jgi:hypothetical protein
MKSVWVPGLAVALTLDNDFTWIDHDGIMVFRSDALALGMKPLVGYWASRIFHHQHGAWQMAESYHKFIQASGVMTEVQGN